MQNIIASYDGTEVYYKNLKRPLLFWVFTVQAADKTPESSIKVG